MKDIVYIVVCCIVGFTFGVVYAAPTILDLELRTAMIDYLNRH